MSLLVPKTRGISLQENALQSESGGDLLQVANSSEILSEQRVCVTLGPFDKELSKMHEAEVHAFSDSVLCTGRGAMNTSNACFTHFSAKKANEIVREIDEWIQQG